MTHSQETPDQSQKAEPLPETREPLKAYQRLSEKIQDAIEKGLILAGHDISAGGMITTLLEMCFANVEGGLEVNLDKLSDIKMWSDICFAELSPVMEDAELTNMAAELLPAEPWNEETFGAWLNEVKTQSGKKGRELFHPLRKALTALENGPELKILLPFIGRERAYKRLKGEKA